MYNYNEKDCINNLLKYYQYNYAASGILFTCCILITYYSDKKYFKGLLSLFIVSWVTWYGHYALHKYPNTPMAKFHKLTHHSEFGKTFWGKFLEYTINEIWTFGGGILWLFILLLKNITGVYWLNPWVIMWWTISVPLVHEVYYHQTTTPNIHDIHHKHHLTSLHPDIWDIILKTKKDNTPIEDETSIAMVMLVWCIIYLFIMKLLKKRF